MVKMRALLSLKGEKFTSEHYERGKKAELETSKPIPW